jgi:hypothetical protein
VLVAPNSGIKVGGSSRFVSTFILPCRILS